MEAPKRRRSLVGNNRKSSKRAPTEMNKDDDHVTATSEEFNDVEVWNTLSNGFKRAQLVLDQNRDLIRRVNDNHLSRIPENVSRNVGLINEINGNISRVMEIYTDLAVDFSKKIEEAKSGDTTATTSGSYGCGQSSCGS
ncbi:Protein ELF4-LIKE 1 [Raphanus sativus]|uniref:Protein ELF4-LIKE 1 n=1 Tax=Raphanus sativus TaxID=3726 RepID=A0A6J0MSU7_RAPSA|nr:protein ELF4-LIKE 1 [Raphanus sativus]KAJ4906376.1 Protein ELF4-LIKE 1 [Raphanus sativus]